MKEEDLELVDLIYDAAEDGIPREKFKERMKKVDEELGGQKA